MGRKNKVQYPDPQDALRGLITSVDLSLRTRIGKGFSLVKADLADAMGGDLSPQAEVLLERAVFLIWALREMEEEMIKGAFDERGKKRPGRKSADPALKDYCATLSSLHRILNTLGLKRVKKEKDLSTVMGELAQEDTQ